MPEKLRVKLPEAHTKRRPPGAAGGAWGRELCLSLGFGPMPDPTGPHLRQQIQRRLTHREGAKRISAPSLPGRCFLSSWLCSSGVPGFLPPSSFLFASSAGRGGLLSWGCRSTTVGSGQMAEWQLPYLLQRSRALEP